MPDKLGYQIFESLKTNTLYDLRSLLLSVEDELIALENSDRVFQFDVKKRNELNNMQNDKAY